MMLSMLSESRRAGVLRGLAIVGVLVAWLAIGGVGGVSVGKLSEVQENESGAFLPAGAESTRADALAAGFRSQETLPALVVAASDDALTPDQLAAVQAYAAKVADLPLGEGRTVGELLAGPVVPVPSEDGKAVLVAVPLSSAAAGEQIGEDSAVGVAVGALRDALTPLTDAGLVAHVAGPAGAIADLVEAFGGIDGLLLLVALGVVFVILVLVYRSPSLPFTVLFTSLFSLSGAALAVYQLAKNDVLVLNGQSQGILFILVVGASTDYSLLLVARYREELRFVAEPHVAMRRAWRAAIEPIAASAGTVIAALLCLLLSDLKSNQSLGPVAAIGIAAAMIGSLTLLPALLLVGGKRARWIFWPRMPHAAGAEDGHDAVGAEPTEHLEARSGVWGRVSAAVGAHPRRVWTVTAVLLVAAAAFAPTFDAEGTSDADVFLTDVDSVAGQEVLAAHFAVGAVEPVTVVAPEADADKVVAAAKGVAGVVDAAPVTEAAAQGGAPVPGGPPAVVDGRVLVEVGTQAAAESQEVAAVVQDVRTAVHAVSPDALVGGPAAQRLDTQLTSERDLRVIVPSVLVVILLVLALLLRSIVAPVIVVVANVLSFAATIGVGALVFRHVFDFPGSDATVPLYAFVFLVALGIDYSIFLMTRVREESLRRGTREGVRRGLAVTGGVITSAGIVLAATFGSLAVLPLLFLVQIAFLVAFGVLLDTLVVRSLLVPGLVADLGRRTWWPWQARIRD